MKIKEELKRQAAREEARRNNLDLMDNDGPIIATENIILQSTAVQQLVQLLH